MRCHNKIRFAEFNSGQRRGMLLFDEVYVKPSIRYRGGHLIGYALDKPNTPAKTILAIMFRPFFGASSFVCRLLPVASLTAQFLVQNLQEVKDLISNNNGSVVGLICDNHPTNRSAFQIFNESDSSEPLFLLNDTVHLFKSIRNNWFTEKSKRLTLTFRGQILTGNWNDIISIYEKERGNPVTRTLLSFEAVFPSPIDRQKVSLMTQVFDDKIVAALRSSGFHATAEFLSVFVRCWKIVNIKDCRAHIKLNDPDRKPFCSSTDDRLGFLEDLGLSVSEMCGGKGSSRHLSLTSETRTAFFKTINGMINLIKFLLCGDHTYVLPGQLQSDRLEAEFGVYR